MSPIILARFSFLLVCGLGLTACGGDNQNAAGENAVVHSKPVVPAASPNESPGKPSPPIRIEYEIMGQPVVGIPLSINVQLSSAVEKPITVTYRINDTTSLAFSEVQARAVSLIPLGDDAFSKEQVTVIPQREGRLYLNVAAEIETEIGTMSQVMAIPIQVGSVRPTTQVNGERITAEDGEAPISMPAKED